MHLGLVRCDASFAASSKPRGGTVSKTDTCYRHEIRLKVLGQLYLTLSAFAVVTAKLMAATMFDANNISLVLQ